MIDDPAGVLDTLNAVTGDTDCYGKQAQELGNISFDGKAPIGTLNYVTGYTGFSGDVSMQTGYFLSFTINESEEIKMYVKDEPVVCDKAPVVNVVFLGATKDVAETSTLKLVKGDKTTTIPMSFISFGETTTMKSSRSKKSTASTVKSVSK